MAEDTTTEKAPERVPSAHEAYLDSLAEARKNEGKAPEEQEVVLAPYALPDNDTDAYVGVSPEYRTYSGEFGKPYQAEEGPTVDSESEAVERDTLVQAPVSPTHPSEAVNPARVQLAKAQEEAGIEPASETPEPPATPKVVPAPKAKSAADPAAPASK